MKKINSIKLFLIVGFMIAACTISICISSMYPFYKEVKQENDFMTQFKATTIVNQNKKINLTKFTEALNEKGIREYVLPPVTYEIKNGGKFYINDIWVISQGFELEEYFQISNKSDNYSQFHNGGRFAIIGDGLRHLTNEKNEKIYIDIFEQEYEVVGFIKDNIFFNISSLISIGNENFYNKEVTQFNGLVKSDHTIEVVKLKDVGFNIAMVDIEKKSIVDRILNRPLELEERMYQLLIGIFNLIVFSYFFATSIKKNIAIKRILGASNKYILKDIFKNISLLATVGTILGLGLSSLMINFMNQANKFAYAPINGLAIVLTFAAVYIISLGVTMVILSSVIRFKIMKEIR